MGKSLKDLGFNLDSLDRPAKSFFWFVFLVFSPSNAENEKIKNDVFYGLNVFLVKSFNIIISRSVLLSDLRVCASAGAPGGLYLGV